MNIPWTALNPAKGADPISIGEIMEDQLWRVLAGRSVGLLQGQDPGAVLQRHVVRAVAQQYREPAQVRLSGTIRSSGIVAVCRTGLTSG